ncbi:MAG: hypothetical protein MUO96_06345 [Actinobacteria bacterium]|nr:hypothetical protein [Actinomycetota bacterium]
MNNIKKEANLKMKVTNVIKVIVTTCLLITLSVMLAACEEKAPVIEEGGNTAAIAKTPETNSAITVPENTAITKETNEEKVVIEKTTTSESNLEKKLVCKEVSFDEVNQGHLMVILTFGQSQAANNGESKYSSKENVYNYYDGKFYTAVDPLLGATGKRGSVWTRLGDKIIEQGLCDHILFVPVAFGASGIESWSPDGKLYHRITDAIDGLRKYNLEVTHMFWSQGSYDSWQHTPEAAEKYKAEFMEIVDGIRKYGVNAPIYVSVETYSYGNYDSFIQQAQRDLVNIDAKIYPGPNNDEIKERWDGVHFSNKGLDKLANLWIEILKEYSN